MTITGNKGIAPTLLERSRRSAHETIRIEREALAELERAFDNPALSDTFDRAVAMIAASRGRLVVTGIGKSGIVGHKIAATMTSTGTPAHFIHAGDASHGDLGMITAEDVVLAVSWSGETIELGGIIDYCRRFRVKLIVMTACPDSTAGRAADLCIPLPPVREACPHQLAPTSSTTVQVVLGDALAIALLEARGFSASDFHIFHPGGRLGAKLTTVGQLMGSGDAIPVIPVGASLMDATIEMSRKRYGSTAIVNGAGELVGVFTDGDLRRSIGSSDLRGGIQPLMSSQPLTVSPQTLSGDALRIMNENAVQVLFVCSGRKLVGVVHIHDVLRAGTA